jgi:hypothetical protein
LLLASSAGTFGGGHARLAEQPEPVFVGERNPAEVRSVDAGNAIVVRQLLVQVRHVRGEQVDDAAVLSQLGIEEQLDLSHECDPEVVVEPREPGVLRRQRPHVARLQPLLEEVPDQCRAGTPI